MQALSFAVHIALVCFGIAFPLMVLVMEWMGHRTGDPLYLTIARRWSRLMVALFAVGVSGFRLVGGKAVDIHPVDALFGGTYLWHELVHMYIAGYIVTGFAVAAAYAIARLRGRWGRYERTALVVPLTIAALASPVQLLVGDWAAREVAKDQPTKLAALEGWARPSALRRSTCSAGITTARSSSASRCPRCSRCAPSTIPTRGWRGSRPCRRRSARR
jgi:cytochrome bd-type quinol oxidase subunit 1